MLGSLFASTNARKSSSTAFFTEFDGLPAVTHGNLTLTTVDSGSECHHVLNDDFSVRHYHIFPK